MNILNKMITMSSTPYPRPSIAFESYQENRIEMIAEEIMKIMIIAIPVLFVILVAIIIAIVFLVKKIKKNKQNKNNQNK